MQQSVPAPPGKWLFHVDDTTRILIEELTAAQIQEQKSERNVVTILDASGSMHGHNATLEELATVAARAGCDVIVFSTDAELVTLGEGAFTRSMLKKRHAWGYSTSYTSALCLALAKGLITPETVVVMVTDGVPDDMRWSEARTSIHATLDRDRGGRFEAYFLGHASSMADGTTQHAVLKTLCTPGVQPAHTDAKCFANCIRNTLRYKLQRVVGADFVSIGDMSAKWLDPGTEVGDTPSVTGVTGDAKLAAAISTVIIAFLRDFGAAKDFPFLGAVRALKSWLGTFNRAALNQNYGFNAMIDALNLFASRRSVARADLGKMQLLFAAANVCSLVTPPAPAFEADAQREWNALLEKATIAMANNATANRVQRKTTKARVKILSGVSSALEKVEAALERMPTAVVDQFPAEGIAVSISAGLQHELQQLKTSAEAYPFLPSAAAVALNPSCMRVETGGVSVIERLSDHKPGDATLLRAFKGVPGRTNADLLQLVYWTLTDGTILTSTAPMCFTTTLLENVLLCTPTSLYGAFVVLDLLKHFLNTLPDNPFNMSPSAHGLYLFGHKHLVGTAASLPVPEWALLAPLLSKGGPFSLLHESDHTFRQLETELKLGSPAMSAQAREWMRYGRVRRPMELALWTQTLMPLLQHLYVAGAMPGSERAFLTHAQINSPLSANAFMARLTTADASAIAAEHLVNGTELTMPLSDEVANQTLLDEFSALAKRAVAAPHALPGVCETFLTLDQVAKVSAWQLAVLHGCPVHLIAPLVHGATSETLRGDCPEFAQALVEAGWQVATANFLHRSKLGAGEFATLTQETTPRIEENVLRFTVPLRAMKTLNEHFLPAFLATADHKAVPTLACLSLWSSFLNVGAVIEKTLTAPDFAAPVDWPVFQRLVHLPAVWRQGDCKRVLMAHLDRRTIVARPGVQGWAPKLLAWFILECGPLFQPSVDEKIGVQLNHIFTEACRRLDDSHVEAHARLCAEVARLPGVTQLRLISVLPAVRFSSLFPLEVLAKRARLARSWFGTAKITRRRYLACVCAFLQGDASLAGYFTAGHLVGLLTPSEEKGPRPAQVQLADVVRALNAGAVSTDAPSGPRAEQERRELGSLIANVYNEVLVTPAVKGLALEFIQTLSTRFPNQHQFSPHEIFQCFHPKLSKGHSWLRTLIAEGKVSDFEGLACIRIEMEAHAGERAYGKKLLLHNKAFRVLPYVTRSGQFGWNVPHNVRDGLVAHVF